MSSLDLPDLSADVISASPHNSPIMTMMTMTMMKILMMITTMITIAKMMMMLATQQICPGSDIYFPPKYRKIGTRKGNLL